MSIIIIIKTLLIVIISVSMVSCSEKIDVEKEADNIYINSSIETIQDNSNNVYQLKLNEIKELYLMPDIEEIAIKVYNRNISKQQIELAKINNKYSIKNKKTEKEIIVNAITGKVIEEEAERLMIKPSQKDVDEYIRLLRDELNNDSVESNEIKDYIVASRLSEDDYLKQQAENIYYIYQKELFFKYLKEEKIDYDKYVEDLISKADIEFLDKELEKVYTQ